MKLITRYAGLTLRNPLIASPSPANARIDWLERLDKAGVGAVVLPSLFQEQIERESEVFDALMAQGMYSSPEAQDYFPDDSLGPYGVGPEGYLGLIRRAKEALSVPVIASLNGASVSGWVDYAGEIAQAGADALELNIYYVPVDAAQSGAEVEQLYIDVLAAVRAAVEIPVIVKIPPFFSSPAHMAHQLAGAGADGLVVFNRYIQPDIDLARLKLSSALDLSQPNEMRLPLLWTAVLAGRVECSLAASGGVETADQLVKFLLAGSDVVMSTAALLRHGPEHAKVLLDGLVGWLESRGVEDVDRIRGVMSHARIREPGAYERANYIGLISSYAHAH